jgi:DNA polymerase-4
MTAPDVTRTILHLDMDAFYASVEVRDDPSLRGKPVVVGGSSRRGVVCAASYEARKFGVHSAMPTARAYRLCPQAIFLPPRMARYAEVSDRVFEVFHRYTPLVEGLSIDEAFLDVTASRSLFGSGETIARRIKEDVASELRLDVSAGVADSKFVAKIASDLHKPNALVVVPPGTSREFLAGLPIERMWGVGAKTAPKLRALGFATLGDLALAEDDRLERVLGSWGAAVRALARGDDTRAVVPDRDAKSIGAEETHENDLTTLDEISRELLASAQRIAQRMLRAGVAGRTVHVKVKLADFTLLTRQTTLPEAAADTLAIHAAACALLPKFPLKNARVRLTGLSVSGLELLGSAPTLFPDPGAVKRQKLEELVRAVSDRWDGDGAAKVTRAALLGSGGSGGTVGRRTPQFK